MFTGIVEEIGVVKSVQIRQSVRTIEIEAHKITADMHIGDSISVNGACLTVIDFNQTSFTVQVIKGTENKTYLADVKRQSEVNLERAMGGNGRFGGHFVLGHVDELETDVLFKYVENILNKDKDQLSVDKLRAFGF